MSGGAEREMPIECLYYPTDGEMTVKFLAASRVLHKKRRVFAFKLPSGWTFNEGTSIWDGRPMASLRCPRCSNPEGA